MHLERLNKWRIKYPEKYNTDPVVQNWKKQLNEEVRELTLDERTALEYFCNSNSVKRTTKHLVKLAMHLHLKGDDKQKTYLLADFARRLQKYSEFEIYQATEYLIETDEVGYFPTFGKMKKIIENKEWSR